MNEQHPLAQRFRGFYPVVIDLETGGLEANKNAVLEIACITLTFDADNRLVPYHKVSYHIHPEPDCEISAASLAVTKIDLNDPCRFAISEKEALQRVFKIVRHDLKHHNCQRAVLVGHNAAFDLGFLNAAVTRQKITRSPFHPFSTFDTVTLSALVFGQTVLEKAVLAAGLEFNTNAAHTAIYDAGKTAELFCYIVNRWQQLCANHVS